MIRQSNFIEKKVCVSTCTFCKKSALYCKIVSTVGHRWRIKGGKSPSKLKPTFQGQHTFRIKLSNMLSVDDLAVVIIGSKLNSSENYQNHE